MATPSTRQAIVQAILKRRTNESYQREKKSMKGYVPSYLEGDEKCVVCGDKATGYHYKCITCEGCKGFFRRTVQKNLENSYQCKQSAQCDINKITRNQCQLCRYKKCISVGMAKDLVLDEEKRLAKRKLIEQNRELRRHKELSQMMAQCGWRIERPTDEERRLIHDVTQAFFQANDTQNKTLQTIRRETGAAERFSVALTAAITNVVDFAKRIPLFVNHISTDDQVLILKVCCMEVITLRCVTSYKNMTKQLTLFPMVDVSKEQLRYTRLEPFCNSLFKLAEHMDSIDLTPVEIALLQAVIILTADRPGISDRARIDQAQDTVIRAFEHHLNEIWPHDPQYCPSLLMKLTEVRAISASLSDTLMSMRMDDPQELGRLFQAPSLSSVIQGFPVSFSMQTPVHQHASGAKRPEVATNHNGHIINGFHRGVVRSFSQPVLNGHRSPQNFIPPAGVGNDDYDAWKTRRLGDLLNQCSGPSASDIPPTTDVPSISPLSQRSCVKSGQSACVSEFASQNTNRQSGIHLPFLTGAYVNSKDGIVYETFRNNHNKIFQRISKSGTLRHDFPSRNNQALAPNQNIYFNSAPRSVDQLRNFCSRRKPNDIPQNTTAVEETATTSCAAVSNSCTYPARLPLHLPRIIPHHPLSGTELQTCVTHENQQLQRKEDSNRVSVTDVSLQNNLITAGILRMGLPMLLPYVTGATATRQELGSALQSRPQVAVHTGELDDRTTQLKPANFGRPSSFVECVASNPNEIVKKPSQTSSEIPQNANSQQKQSVYTNFSKAARSFARSSTQICHSPSKRPISSPTLPHSKVKCTSPLPLSRNNGSAEGFEATETVTKHRGNDKSGIALTKPNSLFAKNGHTRNKTLSDFEQVPHNDLQIRPKSY